MSDVRDLGARLKCCLINVTIAGLRRCPDIEVREKSLHRICFRRSEILFPLSDRSQKRNSPTGDVLHIDLVRDYSLLMIKAVR